LARWRRRTCCTGPTSPENPLRQNHAPYSAQNCRGDTSNLGDTSTLADPGVVEKLLEEKQAIAMPS
jgi:hypothetical protein